MNTESLITAAHDRRQFLLLTLGSSFGFFVATRPSASAQGVSDQGSPSDVEYISLIDAVRVFFVESIGEREPPDRAYVFNKWQKGEELFNSFVNVETEFFEISFKYPHIEGSSVTLSPITLNLDPFEEDEGVIIKKISEAHPEESPLAIQLASKILSIIDMKDVAVKFFTLLSSPGNNLVKPMEDAVSSRDWLKAAQALQNLIKGIMRKEFIESLAAAVGEELAAKFIGKMAKFVPVLGWCILAANLFYTIRQQRSR